jgi:hypothetical protein
MRLFEKQFPIKFVVFLVETPAGYENFDSYAPSTKALIIPQQAN